MMNLIFWGLARMLSLPSDRNGRVWISLFAALLLGGLSVAFLQTPAHLYVWAAAIMTPLPLWGKWLWLLMTLIIVSAATAVLAPSILWWGIIVLISVLSSLIALKTN